MARLHHKKVAGYLKLPWPNHVTQILSDDGYLFTHSYVFDLKFMKVWEVMKGDVVYWARAFCARDAPEGYFQMFFPDGLEVEVVDDDHVCPVVDFKVYDDWVFSFTPPAVQNLTSYRCVSGIVRHWIPQVICGLTNLAARGYIHGDLTAENILIDSNNKIHVTGYSLNKLSMDTLITFIGPNYRYKPPTEFAKDPSAADIWSLGIIIFELLTGEFLIAEANYNPQEELQLQATKYFNALITYLNSGEIAQMINSHSSINAGAANLILSCLNLNEKERPVLALLADHDLFKFDLDQDLNYDKHFLSSQPRIEEEVKPKEDVQKVLDDEGIKIKYILGSGGFGQVFRVKYQNRYLAMKAIILQEEGQEENFEIEKEIMLTVKHKHIVEIIHWFQVPNYGMFFIMELAISDLYDQIHALYQVALIHLLEQQMKRWLHGAALGLQYLHSRGYAHMDFKPLNTLIRSNSVPVVTDFGLSIRISDPSAKLLHAMGTKIYRPPQMHSLRPYTPFAVDVYAFGYSVMQCLHGPVKISQYEIAGLLGNSPVSNEAKDLMVGCLDPREEERFTFEEIVDHPWFTQSTFGQDLPETSRTPSPTQSLPSSYGNDSIPPPYYSSPQARVRTPIVTPQQAAGKTPGSFVTPQGQQVPAQRGPPPIRRRLFSGTPSGNVSVTPVGQRIAGPKSPPAMRRRLSLTPPMYKSPPVPSYQVTPPNYLITPQHNPPPTHHKQVTPGGSDSIGAMLRKFQNMDVQQRTPETPAGNMAVTPEGQLMAGPTSPPPMRRRQSPGGPPPVRKRSP